MSEYISEMRAQLCELAQLIAETEDRVELHKLLDAAIDKLHEMLSTFAEVQ